MNIKCPPQMVCARLRPLRPRPLAGHDCYVTHGQLENDVAYTCSADHTVRKWDMATGGCMHVFRGHTSIVNR